MQWQIDNALKKGEHLAEPTVPSQWNGFPGYEQFFDQPHPFIPDRANSHYDAQTWAQVDVEHDGDRWGAEGWQ